MFDQFIRMFHLRIDIHQFGNKLFRDFARFVWIMDQIGGFYFQKCELFFMKMNAECASDKLNDMFQQHSVLVQCLRHDI